MDWIRAGKEIGESMGKEATDSQEKFLVAFRESFEQNADREPTEEEEQEALRRSDLQGDTEEEDNQ